jgi:hypothetical protein
MERKKDGEGGTAKPRDEAGGDGAAVVGVPGTVE